MYRTTCLSCGEAVQTRGKGHPRFDLQKPLQQHLCPPIAFVDDLYYEGAE